MDKQIIKIIKKLVKKNAKLKDKIKLLESEAEELTESNCKLFEELNKSRKDYNALNVQQTKPSKPSCYSFEDMMQEGNKMVTKALDEKLKEIEEEKKAIGEPWWWKDGAGEKDE